MSRFIGRQEELKRLREFSKNKRTASFIVVQGRRRIGKSRLIEEFGKDFEHFYPFSGLAPDAAITAQGQIDEFCRQMAQQFKTPPVKYTDWSDVFWALGQLIQKGKTLLFFDEISWMGSEDTTFLAKIKNLWDLYLSKNDQLIFVVCGSASSWISKNILSSKGFVGRISYTLSLQELPLSDCNQFWPKNISPYEKLKVLSVTGGIPKYLEEINPKITAEENIRHLCFEKGGLLVKEFEHIFSDLFLRDSSFYRRIVESLVSGAKEREEISDFLKSPPSGRMSEYLDELELAGFITRDHTWKLSTGIDSKLRKYRLSDNYLRFYLKYIQKGMSQIDRNTFHFKTMASMSQWETIMGYQFENLILNSRPLLHQAIGINSEEIICSNPYFQHKTARHAGCQIDYMIQTKFGSLYVCEIKFSKNEIGPSIIPEVQQKIDVLARPRGMSCRPVLIHVNGVAPQVIEEDYFASIVDVGQFLKS